MATALVMTAGSTTRTLGAATGSAAMTRLLRLQMSTQEKTSSRICRCIRKATLSRMTKMMMAHAQLCLLRLCAALNARPVLMLEDSCTPKTCTRWEEAVARAQAVAITYAMELRKNPAPVKVPNEVQRFPKRKKRKSLTRREKIRHGQHHDSFESIRAHFLRKHGRRIVGSLSTVFKEPIELNPAPLSKHVQSRFVQAFHQNAGFDHLVPSFHGTNVSLHDSIFKRGLLIPGQGNDLRVLHGSAHGLGIYTALSPWLSKGFCTAPHMLVCGVLDESRRVGDSCRMGSFSVSRQSEMIRHVGSAVVVFDSCRVAPLFEASSAAWKGQPPHGQQRKRAAARGGKVATMKEARQARKKSLILALMYEFRAAAYLMRRAAQRRRGH